MASNASSVIVKYNIGYHGELLCKGGKLVNNRYQYTPTPMTIQFYLDDNYFCDTGPLSDQVRWEDDKTALVQAYVAQ